MISSVVLEINDYYDFWNLNIGQFRRLTKLCKLLFFFKLNMAVDFAAGGCAALLAISVVHPLVSHYVSIRQMF